MPDAQFCFNCAFYSDIEKSDDDASLGMCRRNPPTVMHFAWDTSSDGDDGVEQVARHTTFPVTMAGEWCGEWRAPAL